MKSNPFRLRHLYALMETFDDQKGPLDRYMNTYFRANKAIGSKDRAFLAETAYAMVRWKGLIDALCGDDQSWENRYKVFSENSFPLKHPDNLPKHVRCSFPKNLYEAIVRSFGEEEGFQVCLNLNERAPTAIRANRLKTTRDDLLKQLSQDFPVEPCRHSPDGILFHQKQNFWVMDTFKEGLFEVQDEASQLVALEVETHPGDHVLDYCSGSGGKTLGFAYKLEGRGQIYLHDIRPHILAEGKKRLKRAGIENFQLLQAKDPKLKKLKKKMDWVLADVPCSGLGTLRRNPDMKWKYTDEMLERLVGEQRMIFEQALSYVKPGGSIVYATCSILKEENQDQVEHFLKTYDLTLVKESFQSIPQKGEMDGLFAAVFKRKS